MTLNPLAIIPVILFLAACASVPKWSPSSSNRELGVARVSYEHGRAEKPAMSDAEAVKLATSRCAGWGFSRADMIPGELRDCSVTSNGSCELWKITREYRCSGEGSYARAASR